MRKKLQSGFTLVELVVVTMLMGIIMTALVIVLRPSQQYYKNITNRAYEEMACISATDIIDGNLRYATALKVIYTDKDGKTSGGADVTTLVTSAEYPNYIKLSNCERETIGQFKARGYAEKGSTSTMKSVNSVLNKELFHDYDYQFAVSGINSSEKLQSLTIDITATPMKQNDAKTDMELDTERSHKFSETFKLLNLRYSGSLGSNIKGLSVVAGDLPEDDGIIWLFYAAPADVASSGSVTTSVTNVGDINPGTYDYYIPTFELKDGDEVDSYRVYFVAHSSVHVDYSTMINMDVTNSSGVTVTKYVGKWDVDMAGMTPSTSATNQFQGGYYADIDFGENTTAEFSIKVNGSVYPKSSGGNVDQNKVLCKFTKADFADSPVKYFYCADTSINEGDLPSASIFLHNTWNPSSPEIGDPNLKIKSKTIHYIHRMGDTAKGVTISTSTSGTGAVSGQTGFVACSGDTDITLVLKGTTGDTAAASVYPGSSTSESDLIHKFDLDDPVDEIWICNGVEYTDPNNIPDDPAPITIHYVEAENSIYTGLNISCQKEGYSEVNGEALPLDPNVTVINLDKSQDIQIVIAPTGNALCSLRTNDIDSTPVTTAAGSIALFPLTNEDSGLEYWLYDGIVYNDPSEMPAYNYDILIHYIYYPGEPYTGMKFFDVDGAGGVSAQVNGNNLPDRNNGSAWEADDSHTFIPHNNGDVDCTVSLKKSTTPVALMLGTNNNSGSVLKVLNSTTGHEIWVCNGSVYYPGDTLPDIPSSGGSGEGGETGGGGETAVNSVSVVIHYNTNKEVLFDPNNQWGEKTGGYTAGIGDVGYGLQNYQKTTDDSSFSVKEGEELVIKIMGGWSSQYGDTIVFSYDALSAIIGDTKEIWIEAGQVYTEKPTDW